MSLRCSKGLLSAVRVAAQEDYANLIMFIVFHVVDYFSDTTHSFDAQDAFESEISLEFKGSSKVIS